LDFGLLHDTGPLAPPFKRSILDIIHNNAHAIALDYIYPDCPLWEFNRAKVVAAAAWMLDQTENGRFRTTMMIDKSSGVLVGFALHFSESSNPTMGRILFYGIVDERFRGQGIFRRILNSLSKEYEGLMMHCRPEDIERIKSLGFHVVGTERTALLMATKEGDYPKLPIPANLYLDSDQVREEDRKLREKLGSKVARQEFRAYIRKQCEEDRRARRVYEQHRPVRIH